MRRISIESDKFCKVVNLITGDEFILVNDKTPMENLIKTILFYEYNELDISIFNPKYDEIMKEIVKKPDCYIWKNCFKVVITNHTGFHQIIMNGDESARYTKGCLKLTEESL